MPIVDRPPVMKVESRKAFRHGFVLNEPDLRRFADTIREQFSKIQDEPNINVVYRIKFRNGAVAETSSIDDVMNLENSGSGRIVSLACEYGISANDDKSNIHLTFVNADEEDSEDSVSIRYLVQARSRDWVFITSTLLDERVAKIKRFALKPARIAPESIFTPNEFGHIFGVQFYIHTNYAAIHRVERRSITDIEGSQDRWRDC